MLEELGCHVNLANEARASLKKVRVIPDLILMDVSMPELDGYEAIAEVRRHAEAHQHIPIVAVTSRNVSGERKRWLNAGMDDHLSKPVRLAELKVMLDRWIPVSHTADHNKPTLKDAL